MNVIPAIDIQAGGTVRLLQGRFDAVTEYEIEPEDLAVRYAALGADWIHCVDLDGARRSSTRNGEIIERIAARIPAQLQVGGGIGDGAAIRGLLSAGVGRVVIGSAAVEAPERAEEWLADFGAARIVLALDVTRVGDGPDPLVAYHGWEKTSRVSLWDALERFGAAGLRHVLCTDIARDGAMQGPAVALYSECVRRFPEVEFQASGGVRNHADLVVLRAAGVAAAIVGRALLEGAITDAEVTPFLRNG
jgi:phosphoribosylformimino-5-aminoimidazole carboxamide ribotide isomerase